jgi:hypothetical protein
MTARIIRVDGDQDQRAFLEFPYRLHKNDPNWVPPLRMQMKEQFDPRHPFLRNGKSALFLAKQNGDIVGRISAHYDTRTDSDVGSFGFYDSIEDQDVTSSLVEAAAGWLREEGRTRMQGPYSWTSHEPIGVLVEGFDTPNMLMMNHNPEYYDALLQGAGLQKKKDLWAWRFHVGDLPEHISKEYQAALANPRLRLRRVDLKRFEDEIGVVAKIYNEAWKNNWGFTPITKNELRATAKGLRPIVDPDFVLFAEVDGKPAGMAVAVPNVNEAIRDLKGSLLPTGWARLLWRLKVKGTKTARMMLLGILPEHRGEMSRDILMGLYGRLHENGTKNGYQWGELSWTLEDNDAINKSIARTGSKRYKTYRLYETKV